MASRPTVDAQALPFLRTKLYAPPLRSELVSRPRLIKRLNAGLWRAGGAARKLTLVSAPAGFGKTTLVSAWAQSLGNALPTVAGPDEAPGSGDTAVSFAWLSLDEGDNDVMRFLAYLIAALQTAEAGLGGVALSRLQSQQPPPAEVTLSAVINDVAVLSTRIILVLDDYHLIEAQAIHQAVAFILRHQPPQLHLAIVTREDPFLPVGRLRARGEMTELRAADLRFTPTEATAFLNEVMGLALSSEDVAALAQRTEGWIAGIQLAALSMQGRRDVSSFVRSFTGSHRFVLDYLVEEVLDRQPAPVQTFLLQTSILARMSGSLCDAVRLGRADLPTGTDDGQTTLEALERANLFIIPLDHDRRWYRYHHLFADLLRRRLRQTYPDQIPTLHQRASAWFEHHDLPADAIRHAYAAEDLERVADLAELAWPDWSETYKAIIWLGWVKALPDAVVQNRPVLGMAYAWAYLNSGQLEQAESKIQDAERWLEPPTGRASDSDIDSPLPVVVDDQQFQALPVQLAIARAYLAQATGNVSGTVTYVTRALDLLPQDDAHNRASVTALLALAYWASGDVRAAQRVFPEGLFYDDYDLITGTFVRVGMRLALGRLREAFGLCEHALQLADKLGEPVGTEDVYIARARLHRERGELERAAQDLAKAKDLGDQVELPDWYHRWYVAQAGLSESRGYLDGALGYLDQAARSFVRTPVPDVQPIPARRAQVLIKLGRLGEAEVWARERGLSVDDALSFLHEYEHITLARLHLARYRRDGGGELLYSATSLLDRLLIAAEDSDRMGSAIEILILRAIAFEAEGRVSDALVPLERALVLAEPEGYVSCFVDEGAPMARLLYEALSRGISPAYVGRLLSAVSSAEPGPPVTGQPLLAQEGLLEPLSEREIEVLQLIGQGFTNPEIAKRLYLSLNTVKVHTRNIYGKLDVHNRTQAVARGRALGLLSDV